MCLVSRPDYGEIYRQLGIDIVLSPRTVASEHVLRYCHQHELQSLTVLEEGQAEVLELVAHDGSTDCRHGGQAASRSPGAHLLAAILKGDRVIIPGGDDTINVGDTVVVLTTPRARQAVARLFQHRS